MTSFALRVVRALGAGALAGAVAGIIAGGVGSRLAMRVVGATAGPEMVGRLTENGNRVGDVTLPGTLDLVIFIGILPGMLGGILYVAVAPWVTSLGAWRGVSFGLGLLAVFGGGVLSADNPDFRRFGVPLLNVVLFAALFPLYGAALAPLADRLEREDARRPALRWFVAAAGVLALALIALGVVATYHSLASGERGAGFGVAIFAALAAGAALRWLAGRPRVRKVAYTVLIAPLAVGLAFTVTSVGRILAP